jgi:hypothetical protein
VHLLRSARQAKKLRQDSGNKQGAIKNVEKGRVEKGRVEKGRVEKGRVEKGRVERGRVEKGRVEKGRVEKGCTTLVAAPHNGRKGKQFVTCNALMLGMADTHQLFRDHTGGIVTVVGKQRLALNQGRQNQWAQGQSQWAQGQTRGGQRQHAWGGGTTRAQVLALPAALV